MSNMDLRASTEHAAKKIKVNQLLAPTPRTVEAHALLLSKYPSDLSFAGLDVKV